MGAGRTIVALGLAWLVVLGTAGLASAAGVGAGGNLGQQLPLASIIPFGLMLAAIAVLPLAAGHWWEQNRNKAIIAGVLSVPLALWLGLTFGEPGWERLLHTVGEYISFLALLGALFVITGNIYVRGSLSGTPLLNTTLLAIGAVLANLIGTTGASMLLIRPLLRANAPRQRTVHLVIFFIFIVSNCAGLLTPLGDPPLFLGFLKGVPFEWTLRLWPQWLLVNGALLVTFHIMDELIFDKEEIERPGSQLEEVQRHEPIGLTGWHNLLLLAGIVLVIYASGQGWGRRGQPWPFGVQEALMVGLAAVAYFSTPGKVRESNRFGFGPIIEVAVVFAGIFITMVPALLFLNAHGKSLGLAKPWQFFWASGALSSFLDNAPTYLAFAATACGLEGVPLEGRYLATLLAIPDAAMAQRLLAAISCGAVFMGANTYIGNGPNFMVKAIAEQHGIKMPSFFGYMAYSGAILIPLFVVVSWIFFR